MTRRSRVHIVVRRNQIAAAVAFGVRLGWTLLLFEWHVHLLFPFTITS